PGQERQAHPRHGPHTKALQHMDMRVTAADEHQIVFYPPALLHRTTMPELGAENETSKAADSA
ncbi:MAG TPA: hypothetical protein VE687_18590, partial [Stellaceae bacterium]|nr:hypothetical protein [Stellaceae bacterium]